MDNNPHWEVEVNPKDLTSIRFLLPFARMFLEERIMERRREVERLSAAIAHDEELLRRYADLKRCSGCELCDKN